MTQIQHYSKPQVDALFAELPPPTPTTIVGPGTYIASGGSVAYITGLTFRVSAGVAYINFIRTPFVTTDITLSAANGSNPRLDAIVVGSDGLVVKVDGTAAATPALPDLDPVTQAALTYILVPTSATSLSITTTDIYKENTEWTSSVSGGTVVANSTTNPYAGTKDIEFTAAATGAYARLTNGSSISLVSGRQLIFQIRSKAAWPNPKSLLVTWYNSGVKIGQSVGLLTSGSFGFDSSITSGYQQVAIPISQFLIPGSAVVDRVEFKVNGGGGSIGLYIDDVVLESTSSVATPPVPATPQNGTFKVAIGDETTALTTGTAKVTFRMPYAMNLTAIRSEVNTVSSSGTPTFDVNKSGSTILSTKSTIDVSEKTSTTAATPSVLNTNTLDDDEEITIDIDVAGTGAKGAKITFVGTIRQ
jgi:hypothetical protein